MQQYTRNLIRETFIKELNQHPLNKVTVTKIVEECEINRNTFYYYYKDIYEVLTEVFEMELKKVIEEYNETLSWEESFILATRFAKENKAAVYHIYYSLKREELETYILNVAGNVMERYVSQMAKGMNVSLYDQKLIASFYQCALTQMVLQWIASGMKSDSDAIIRRIGQLFDGNIKASLNRAVDKS